MYIPPDAQTMMKLANVEAIPIKEAQGLVFMYKGAGRTNLVDRKYVPIQLLVTPQDWVAAIVSVMPEHL